MSRSLYFLTCSYRWGQSKFLCLNISKTVCGKFVGRACAQTSRTYALYKWAVVCIPLYCIIVKRQQSRFLQLFPEGQGNPQELLVVHNEAECPRFGLLPQRHLLQSLLLQGCPVPSLETSRVGVASQIVCGGARVSCNVHGKTRG